MKAHQDYAIVRLIARVPGSFNKHVSSPHPFSLLTLAYLLFIYLGFNTSSCDLQARGISLSISIMPHATLLQLNICLTEGWWELHASLGTLFYSLCGRSQVFKVFKDSWDTPENRDMWRGISCLYRIWCSLVRPAKGLCQARLLAWPQGSLHPSDDAADYACCRTYTEEPDRCLLKV